MAFRVILGIMLAVGVARHCHPEWPIFGLLHRWTWLARAIIGNSAGIYLRPIFDLSVERRQSTCGSLDADFLKANAASLCGISFN